MNDSDMLLVRAALASAAMALAGALLGVHLFLRRLLFLGLVVPQASALGTALALAVSCIVGCTGHEHSAPDSVSIWNIGFAGAVAVTIPLVLWLGRLAHTRRLPAELVLGAVYVAGMGGALLLMALNPHGSHDLLQLYSGHIISITWPDLVAIAVMTTVVACVVILSHRRMLSTGLDPEFARACGVAVHRWETLLLIVVGLVVSVGTVTVGPTVTFGYMVCPVLCAWFNAGSFGSFMLQALAFSVVGAELGTGMAFWLDLPVGSSQLSVLGAGCIISAVLGLLIKPRTVTSDPRQSTPADKSTEVVRP